MMCNCSDRINEDKLKPRQVVLSSSWVEKESHASIQALTARSASFKSITTDSEKAAKLLQENTNLIITPAGNTLLSSHFSVGTNGDVVIRGAIGPFPLDAHFQVSLDSATASVSITLTVLKPIAVGPYTWKFNLHGLARNASGDLVGAKSVVPSQDMQAFDRGVGCYVKCAGWKLLPVVVGCIPSLAGGPVAFVGCIVAAVGLGQGQEIAECIIKDCT